MSKHSYIGRGLPHQGDPCQSPQGTRPKHWGCTPGSAASLCRWLRWLRNWKNVMHLLSKLDNKAYCQRHVINGQSWQAVKVWHTLGHMPPKRENPLKKTTPLNPSLQACNQQRQIRIKQRWAGQQLTCWSAHRFPEELRPPACDARLAPQHQTSLQGEITVWSAASKAATESTVCSAANKSAP